MGCRLSRCLHRQRHATGGVSHCTRLSQVVREPAGNAQEHITDAPLASVMQARKAGKYVSAMSWSVIKALNVCACVNPPDSAIVVPRLKPAKCLQVAIVFR
jgi:hypothetical protein